jgi:hypothetical protein
MQKKKKEEEPDDAANAGGCGGMSKTQSLIMAFLALCTIGLLISTIILAVRESDQQESSANANKAQEPGDNPCMGKRPDLDNVACVSDQIEMKYTTGEQSGVNVTMGYQGERNTTAEPIIGNYRDAGLCPVNVHWHLGTEHYSKGEFDEEGSGPIEFHEGRIGFQCRYYNEDDPKFNTPYEWQHCIGMTIGQTYEVHWPHSKAGMCNTPWQYQTPFYDGVFCKDNVITANNTAQTIGVQSQTFVVVNDEDYFYPDLFRGMIVDEEKEFGTDVAKYTGSTTGTARDNEICSPFTPITWQVDRKCHLISASSFDKMCGEMKSQADNLSDDLYAHGSRELVKPENAANNQQLLRGRH